MLNKQNLFGSTPGGDRYRRDPQTPGAGPQPNPLMQPNPAAGAPAGAPAGVESAKPAPAPAAGKSQIPGLDEGGGSRLIVGPDIKLKGAEITDCDTLVVEGRVEASMDSRVIQIAEHGAFHGTVGIDIAEIYGEFDGELTARKQLVIRSTGRVNGKIRYGKLVIEEGGELCGDIATLSSDSARSSQGHQQASSSKPGTPAPALQPAGSR